jgi:serine/threonine protein phosphatase PrpC
MEDAALAVQVGEDAYFFTDNAMGVADGVGGWKNRAGAATKPSQTPSALFATRLMHYCSDEVTNHYSATSPYPSQHAALFAENEDTDELYSELEDSLSELEEGIDMLMILENAFDRAIKAHVTPVVTSDPQVAGPSPPLASSPDPEYRPLNAGSSTALLAVLQHPAPPRRAASPRRGRSSSRSRSSQSERAAEEHHPRGRRDDAVIKIANLGDSMAMLVRGREIVWRSEEMWWSFNTPVQLGPVSPSRPKDAQMFNLPVQADDILILASDGLSDNLWDEEVLEEVVRVRELLLRHSRADDETSLGLLGRRSIAGMLSEALCSRARRVAERGHKSTQPEAAKLFGVLEEDPSDEVPFARRAREEGKKFKGGKVDDISVLVAVVSPVEPARCARP